MHSYFLLCSRNVKLVCSCLLKGFTVDFKSMKNLPCGETQTFTVKFDPHEASLKEGSISVVMPIEVSISNTVTSTCIDTSLWLVGSFLFLRGLCFFWQATCGPTVQVRLSAVVTVPTITVSSDTLHFDTVQCGMCQVRENTSAAHV